MQWNGALVQGTTRAFWRCPHSRRFKEITLFAQLGALTLTLALLTALPLRAQTLTQGAVEGIVRDASGNPLSGVVVTLNDRTGSGTTSRTSGKDGRFILGLVPPGEYDLLLEAFGHRPLRIEMIPVNAGSGTRLDYALTPARDAVGGAVEQRYYITAGTGASERLTADDLARFPEQNRLLTSALRLSSNANPLLESEGLPGRLSGVWLDGLPIATPPGGNVSYLPVTLPLSVVRSAELLTGSADVEWSGSATSLLSAHSVVAGNTLQLRTFGDWSSASLDQAGLTAPQHTGVRAGGIISGPIVRDTASLVVGAEFWRVDAPIAFAARLDSISGRVLETAENAYGVSDPGFAPLHLTRSSAFTGFGRLDWLLSDNSRLQLSSVVTTLPQVQTVPLSGEWAGVRSAARGSDLFVAARLDSRLGEHFGQQLTAAWSRSVRDYTDDASTPAMGSTTYFVEDGLALGQDPLQAGRREAQAFRARATLHYWGTRHHVKGGVSADLTSFDTNFGSDRTTRFWFSDASAFEGGLGFADHRRGSAQSAFDLPRIGLFLQDEWSIGSRARMLLGLRWDFDNLPADRFRLNSEWLRLTGISIDSLKSRHGRLAPRFEFEWQPDAAARWTVRANAGVWDAAIDPGLIAEAIAYDGSAKVLRGFGRFDEWPAASDSGAMPTLTLLAAGFQAPRSTRAGASISRTLSPGIDLGVSVAYRRTEFLPRRSDANLSTIASAQDQYGREIFGTLQQQGSVLGAVSGSDRRFAPFDIVSVVGVDGWSEYLGVSAALQAQVSRALILHARYTWSRTDDNWFMARGGNGAGEVLPLQRVDGVDWSEARSDFDTPHRAVIGAEVSSTILGGIRAAALYRYRSGYPFTPGFRDGIDANADGSMRNDPAYVDPDLPGFADVAGAFPCLRSQAGRFAGRNSCRADGVRSLDLRLAVGVYRTESRSAEIVFDALNLLSSGAEERDRALYLVDPSGSLSQAGQVVHVPLLVNPSFGAPLLRTAPGEMLRIGIRVTR